MITLSHKKESLTRSFIQAIAGRCGMTCSYAGFDYGIDVQVNDVHSRLEGEKRRYVETGFTIGIQAKSTTIAEFERDSVVYDLDVKNYNDLRDLDIGAPRIVVVLILPESEDDWLALTEEELILRRCAYWCSLKGREETDNETAVRKRGKKAVILEASDFQVVN